MKDEGEADAKTGEAGRGKRGKRVIESLGAAEGFCAES
jgi:hypothetical protein